MLIISIPEFEAVAAVAAVAIASGGVVVAAVGLTPFILTGGCLIDLFFCLTHYAIMSSCHAGTIATQKILLKYTSMPKLQGAKGLIINLLFFQSNNCVRDHEQLLIQSIVNALSSLEEILRTSNKYSRRWLTSSKNIAQ